ncbi:hypothetical protein M9978_10430 [Sphingomonas sp. MG17]|uniref:Uncharacterized protein n=1 Tax=Sphingomonas tagetis TaxID=2949092 RepID=A0A9X2HS23_9SPHN|nr:hypothetical protein [Sphingomonas tagetis]MCP3730845.1 hypothetical protein [Sphingomonas tagetis]
MSTDDAAYYRKRASQEREKAATCEDNAIALAHLQLADEYDQRAQIESSTPPDFCD